MTGGTLSTVYSCLNYSSTVYVGVFHFVVRGGVVIALIARRKDGIALSYVVNVWHCVQSNP